MEQQDNWRIITPYIREVEELLKSLGVALAAQLLFHNMGSKK
jgi:hypothetical protein